MDKNIAIEFNNVGKQYRLGLVGTGSLQHDLNRWWQTTILRKEDPYLKIGEVNDRSTKGNSDYVWALKDISFKVEQGDVVGIIGKNGAGKSTLLKLLSHITAPSTGTIDYRGRIASLLEVGTGFHPEMTARQNIYMNGSIMGMTKHEIDKKLDEIVDFAGIERYLDTPVKRFSSGMTVRLGFAVAAFLEPEILVVDEVLAVGDAEFQKKAIGKMKDVSSQGGRTVLFVSHNMASIKQLCNRGIVLQNGQMVYDNNVSEAVKYYVGSEYQETDNFYFENLNEAPGNEFIRVRSFQLKPTMGDIINISSGIDIEFQFYNAKENIILDASLQLMTMENVVVFHKNNFISPNGDSKKGEYKVKCHIPANLLNEGKYELWLWFGESNQYLIWGTQKYYFEVGPIVDKNTGFSIGRKPGVVMTDLNFKTDFLK